MRAPAAHRSRSPFLLRAAAVLAWAVFSLSLAACGSGGGSLPPALPDDPPPTDPTLLAQIHAAWGASAHNDVSAKAFNYWNAEGAVPASCARCHSTPGFRDYLGDDGSAPFSVDSAHPIGTTVSCDACHNPAAQVLSEVRFPSGAVATGLGAEARCMTCHMGRESTVSMNSHIAGAEVADDDTPNANLRFRNIHYFAAGATLYGGSAKGAYQYTLAGPDGVVGTTDDLPKYGFYDRRNPHVKSHDTCIECHDPHTLQVRVTSCATCHAGITSVADLKNIRMNGSVRDYDGDGNATEGIYYELLTLSQTLYAAMRSYAANVLAKPITYDEHAYPYFFVDTNGNDMRDEGEVGYAGWSARLLRAAYNYQYYQKDPGAYAHNPKYTIEFLYDSIADLNAHALVTVPNFSALHRNDSGHFDAGAQAFRRWDRAADLIEPGSIELGVVATACARCHSPGGFDFWAEWGLDVTKPQEVGDGFRCEQCHIENADFLGTPEVKYIPSVTFASGVKVNNTPADPDNSFLCISCHRGREAKLTVDNVIASGNLSFRNIHYQPAGATLWGSDAAVGYQYPTKVYAGKWQHFGPGSTSMRCDFCHLADHTFKAQTAPLCVNCHGAGPLELFRINRTTDYDGNGNNLEPLRNEVKSFGDRLLATMQDYAATVRGLPLAYDEHAWPYFFRDNNPTNGVVDPAEATSANGYKPWDAALLKASFNYQFWKKEPGAWAHNTHYILQILYDSIEDLNNALGGTWTNGLTRP